MSNIFTLSCFNSQLIIFIFFFTEAEDPSEDRINIYDDDPARGNLQSSENRMNVKNSSAYHCEGPSSSKEAAGTSGAKSSHHYQEINSLRLGDRYEIYHPEIVPEETETKTATAYETPITRKDRVSWQC